jgi:uncharacterized protein (TIGR00369 family)
MRKINPDFVSAVTALANGCPYFRLLSMTIRELGKGFCLMEAEVVEKYAQAFGNVHGGVYASLVDTAAFWAAFCDLDENVGITTVDLNIHYLASVQSGKLLTRGKLIKLGKTLGLAEAEITTGGGKLVAHGTTTIIVIPGLSLVKGKNLPPKFLEA